MFRSTLTAAAVLLAAGSANAAVITFDDPGFSSGDVVTSVSVDGVSASVSATGGAAQAMIFDTRLGTGGDTDLLRPFYSDFDAPGVPSEDAQKRNPKNVLIISEDGDSTDPDDNASGGTITFDFERAVNFRGFRVFDDVTDFVVRSDKGDVSDSVSLDFDNQWARVDVNFTNITQLVFDFGNASGAIDNLRVFAVDPSPVPVPAGLPLLLAGLGALGFARSRK